MQYPPAKTVEQIDDYHGVAVRDPYRWLEDADSAETRAWIEAENRVTGDFLKALPDREAIKERLTTLWNYERFSAPYVRGGRYFFSKNDGLQNQSVLYVGETRDDAGRMLLDPNTLSADGTVALSGTAVSDDGTLLAYGLSAAGSDWQEWRVRDIATGKDRPDHLKWIKFGGASWTKDGKGFFYARFAAPAEGAALQQVNQNQKIYYHRLGEEQSQDTLIYERPDHPDWYLGAGVTEDGRYLLLYAFNGTDPKARIALKDLSAGLDAPVTEFLATGDAAHDIVGNNGPVFFSVTDKDAPKKRLVAIDSRDTAPEKWRTIVPEAAETLDGVALLGDRAFASYLKDAKSAVKIYDLSGAFVRDFPLPGIGTVGGLGDRRDSREFFYAFSGYTTPTTIYRYDAAAQANAVYKRPTVAFDPEAFVTEQVFYPSKDGTKIPMFLTYKKGLKRNGKNPTYLYGYGGFNISLTPAFSVSNLVWMERGGIYAVANLRGGAEYGEAWHEAGTKLKKQNVFDDFIAAAEFLIREKYTSRTALAIAGGSNGGLLVGACLTQRPDLFGAALPAVGVLDMLRYHKFTVGWGWIPDYGSPENPDEFKALYAYSPYHNLKKGTRYPATLVTTSDHDDRVVPAHSFKFAAALQAAQAPDGPPTLIRIETRAGHGAGKPIAKVIEEIADVYAFLGWALK